MAPLSGLVYETWFFLKTQMLQIYTTYSKSVFSDGNCLSDNTWNSKRYHFQKKNYVLKIWSLLRLKSLESVREMKITKKS